MANEHFRGTNLGITGIAIEGSYIIANCSFVDDEGKTHATTRHKIVIGEHEDLRTPAEALLEALSKHIANIHFGNPDNTTTEEGVTRAGIAESLKNVGADDTEGFEEGS